MYLQLPYDRRSGKLRVQECHFERARGTFIEKLIHKPWRAWLVLLIQIFRFLKPLMASVFPVPEERPFSRPCGAHNFGLGVSCTKLL
jgi:hypothetical protein